MAPLHDDKRFIILGRNYAYEHSMQSYSQQPLVFNTETNDYNGTTNEKIVTLFNKPQLAQDGTVVAVDMPTGVFWRFDARNPY